MVRCRSRVRIPPAALTMKIFVLGPAGCGKSSFVKAFSEYLREMDLDVKCVNLDPATDPVFDASVDIRSFVKTEEIMKKFTWNQWSSHQIYGGIPKTR